jgi:truncated hemoglobin YjbI
VSDETKFQPWRSGPAVRKGCKVLFDAFYAKVPNDPILAPVFAGMDPRHAEHVAAFVGEVFGGPKAYTEGGGGHASMIGQHMGRHLTARAAPGLGLLMLDTADEVGLPRRPGVPRRLRGLSGMGHAPGGDQLGRGRRGAPGRAAHAGVGLGAAGRSLAGVTCGSPDLPPERPLA